MVWGCGTNDSGDLGYRSNQSSTIGSAYDLCRLTNMVTLEQVQNNGSLTILVPTNANYRTSPDIYSRGNVVSVSGGWNESFMIDSSTELRAAGGVGNYDTSLVAETGSNQYQFHRMVITVDRLNGEAVIPEELERQLDTGYELTYYVNDINRANTEVLVDYSKRDNSQNSYAYGLERLWGELKQGNSAAVPEIYLYDGRGSVSQVVNNSNALKIQYRYDPFGVMTKGEPTQNAIYGYNAEDYNPTIESQYLRARYYKPGSGRFSTRDEYLGDVYDPLSLNLYSYVKNNPVNYIDPSGYKTDIDELRAEKIYLANLQKSQVSAPAPNNSSSANLTAEALAELLAVTTIVAWVFTGVIPPAAAGVVGSSLREALVPGLTLAVEAAEAANNYLISRGKSVYQLSYVEREALLKKQIEAIIQKSCELPNVLVNQNSVALRDGMLPGQTYAVIDWNYINWDRVIKGLITAAGGAGSFLTGASALVSGGGAMFVPGIGWLYGLPAILSGLTAAGIGGATFLEGIQEIWYGLTGNNTVAQNMIRDKAFKENEDYYYLLEYASTYLAGYTGQQANQLNNAYNASNFLNKPASKDGILNIGAGQRPIEGAYNIDKDPLAPGVYAGNATDLSNIATGSQSQIIMENPYRYDALNPEINRVLESGGTVNITGGITNRWFKDIYNMTEEELNSLGYSIVSKGPSASQVPGLTTEGEPVQGMVLEIILKKN